jgi:cobalt-zinc-cadmium efflux system protein
MSSLESHIERPASRGRRNLAIVFTMVLVMMVVEVIAGFLTGSLALISDAGHMATDALGLGMALAAIVAADRAGLGDHRTFGLYRLEILAALANSVLLVGAGAFVLYEAIRRLANPIEVLTGPMLVVAVVGLAVNVVGWWILRPHRGASVNMEAARLEVMADLWGSLGVIVAALITRFTDWPYADPLFAVAIGLFILPRAFRLGRQSVRVLVQAAPVRVDLDAVRKDLASIDGVSDVHDLHVWTLTSDMDVASVHLMIGDGVEPHPVLDQATALLRDDHGIAHATLQVEPITHAECQETTW